MHAGIPPGKENPLAKQTPSPSQGDPPSKADPPLQGDPPGKAGTPPAQCMLADTVNKRVVCILLECNSCWKGLLLGNFQKNHLELCNCVIKDLIGTIIFLWTQSRQVTGQLNIKIS